MTLSGSPAIDVTLDRPEFFLAPAQQITDGQPPAPPQSIGFFKAFTVDPASAERLGDALRQHIDADGIDRCRVSHLAVPADYWHHDDYTRRAIGKPF